MTNLALFTRHHTLFAGLVLRCVYLGRRLGVGSPTSVVLIAPPPDTMPPPSWSERLSQYSSPYETSTSAPHGMSRVASVAMWHPLTDTYDGNTPLVLQLRWPARHGIASVKPVTMRASRLHSRPGSAEFPTASGQLTSRAHISNMERRVVGVACGCGLSAVGLDTIRSRARRAIVGKVAQVCWI